MVFGEGARRILLELDEAALVPVENLAKEAGVEFTRLGRTGGKDLKVTVNESETVWTVAELKKFYENSLPNALR